MPLRKSDVSIADMDSDLEDSVSNAGSGVPSTIGRGKATRASRKLLDGTFVGNVDDCRVSDARKTVMQFLKVPDHALRLEYICKKQLTKTKSKLTGDLAILPMCANKYHLLGRERVTEQLLMLKDDLDPEILDLMKLADLYDLQDWALALGRPCAVASKIWGEAKAGAKERYDSLKGKRLDNIAFIERGDAKSKYFEVDYTAHGAYSKVFSRGAGKNRKIIALTHISGITAKLAPPLDVSYEIQGNNKDMTATLISPNFVSQVICYQVFERAGKHGDIPTPLEDDRVASAIVTPTKGAKRLAIMNSPSVSTTGTDESPETLAILDEGDASARPSKRPRGSGAGKPPVARKIN